MLSLCSVRMVQDAPECHWESCAGLQSASHPTERTHPPPLPPPLDIGASFLARQRVAPEGCQGSASAQLKVSGKAAQRARALGHSQRQPLCRRRRRHLAARGLGPRQLSGLPGRQRISLHGICRWLCGGRRLRLAQLLLQPALRCQLSPATWCEGREWWSAIVEPLCGPTGSASHPPAVLAAQPPLLPLDAGADEHELVHACGRIWPHGVHGVNGTCSGDPHPEGSSSQTLPALTPHRCVWVNLIALLGQPLQLARHTPVRSK